MVYRKITAVILVVIMLGALTSCNKERKLPMGY